MDFRIAFAALLLACDPAVTVSSGSALQVSWDEVELTNMPALLVIVVDDGADAGATALRASITREALVSSFDSLLRQRTPAPYDPASGFTGDARVVIVHPRSRTFVTPLDDARLRISATATKSQLAATADAVLAHASEAIVRRASPYPIIAGTRDIVSLLLRERTSRDAREAAVVDSMPAFRTVSVTVLTSRDDDGEIVPLPPDAERQTVWYVVEAPCSTKSAPDLPHLQAWSKALRSDGFISSVDCVSGYVFFGGGDYSCGLSGDDIARDPDGNGECSITFDASLATCDRARGWADPIGRDGVRRPWFDEIDGVTMRRCEIVQLTGAARQSCEQSLACERCTPGFCLTSLIDEVGCPSLARFVGGSLYYDDVSQPKLHFTCNLR